MPGFDPLGLTLKSNPDGAGVTGVLSAGEAPLSEGAGLSDGCVMEPVPVSVPGVTSCANAAGGNSGAIITIKEIIAVNVCRRFLALVVIVILMATMVSRDSKQAL
jgi:hypothetical protein